MYQQQQQTDITNTRVHTLLYFEAYINQEVPYYNIDNDTI